MIAPFEGEMEKDEFAGELGEVLQEHFSGTVHKTSCRRNRRCGWSSRGQREWEGITSTR